MALKEVNGGLVRPVALGSGGGGVGSSSNNNGEKVDINVAKLSVWG